MATDNADERVAILQARLQTVAAQFDSEARKRGFDPAQAEHMALPATLARLFAERAEIVAELEELSEHEMGD